MNLDVGLLLIGGGALLFWWDEWRDQQRLRTDPLMGLFSGSRLRRLQRGAAVLGAGVGVLLWILLELLLSMNP